MRAARGAAWRRAAAAAAAALCIAAAGCEAGVGDARPQWRVFVGTDARLPQFGDRLLLEVLSEDGSAACLGCRRQLGAGDPDRWPFSFGVVPPEDGGALRVRARLYRADHTGPDGLPFGVPVIDALARLPPADAPVDVGISLSMACLTVASDVAAAATCDAATGALAGEPVLQPADQGGALPTPGTWPGAEEIPCAGEPPEGMVCHPGGLFVLGDPYFFPVSDDLAPLPEHLLRLSPFALDADEVTVGAVRGLVASGAVAGAPVSKGSDPQSLEAACTYLGVNDGANDALPANCLSRDFAASVCAALGKRLPTEAEWEYAAVNRTRETRFPWGNEEAACAHAIVGRGRFISEIAPGSFADESTVCRGAAGDPLPWGPAAGGAEGDVTDLGVKNLGGNVSEWVEDRYNRYDEGCWTGAPAPLVDPRCASTSPSVGPAWSIRGASWDAKIFRTRSVERNASTTGGPSVSTGFRCAQSM